ncbi:MAG: putative phage tail protein [Desulfitobacterium sp.]
MGLINLLPDYYTGNETMEELQGILSGKINALAGSFDETIDQCFVNTATGLLSRYEEIYGLQVDVSKSNEFRRERIRAKIRGVGTTTRQMIVDVASSYSNGEVEVIEDSANSNFKIRFIGTTGIPPNMTDLTLTIEEIKPAHLSYTFEYIYRLHSEISAYTHAQLSAYTHETLRSGVIT